MVQLKAIACMKCTVPQWFGLAVEASWQVLQKNLKEMETVLVITFKTNQIWMKKHVMIGPIQRLSQCHATISND